jgi:two-component system, NarL family, nitrate/nitrite response regulator NarL
MQLTSRAFTTPPATRIARLRVVVAEGSWVWANAIARELEADPTVAVVGVTGDADEAVALAERFHPHVVIAGAVLGEGECGLRTIGRIATRLRSCRAVVLAERPSEWVQVQADAVGAAVILRADVAEGSDVLRLVRAAARGSLPRRPARRADPLGDLGLTPSEAEIVQCLLRGLGTGEIAARLSLGAQTVRNKTHRIGRKLGVSGRAAIIARALELGVVPVGASLAA